MQDMYINEMVRPPLIPIRVMKVLMGIKAMEILYQKIPEIGAAPAAEQTGVFRIAISTDVKVRRSVTSPRL